ncbi:MAG: hypothetical protein F6K58_02465 [Symploca sp. SIO2E9]|nr:hypothetical protein [Symploca sp. SIO2E9]
MKLNSTVALTLTLLAMMLGVGLMSALWGFTLGHEALKGVTQPDVRPTKKLAGSQKSSAGKEGVTFLREEDILINVDAYIRGKGNNSKNNDDQARVRNSQTKTEQNLSPHWAFNTQKSFTSPNSVLKLPVKSHDRGVTLEVRSASKKGSSLLLDVSMKNEGSNDVRFLYSFLNIMDDKGRALSAITEGLPGELPANGQEFSGTVSIPTALLDNSRELSLKLTDYPEQKLQLQTSEIPVVR